MVGAATVLVKVFVPGPVVSLPTLPMVAATVVLVVCEIGVGGDVEVVCVVEVVCFDEVVCIVDVVCVVETVCIVEVVCVVEVEVIGAEVVRKVESGAGVVVVVVVVVVELANGFQMVVHVEEANGFQMLLGSVVLVGWVVVVVGATMKTRVVPNVGDITSGVVVVGASVEPKKGDHGVVVVAVIGCAVDVA